MRREWGKGETGKNDLRADAKDEDVGFGGRHDVASVLVMVV